MLTPLRDYRDQRDWRIWIDPPGFFTGQSGCFCCPSTSCTPACASVGASGCAGGNACTTCGTSVILDGFGSSLDAAWISAGAGCAGAPIGPSGAQTVAGQLITSGSTIIRPFARPAITGLCVECKVTMVTVATSGTGVGGIVIAYGREMFARPLFGNYGRQSCIDANGCIGGGSDFQPFGPAPANGDVLSIIITDAGGGDRGDGSVICNVCYKINGTSYRTESNVLCCFPSTMYAGVIDSNDTIYAWDDFEVRTN